MKRTAFLLAFGTLMMGTVGTVRAQQPVQDPLSQSLDPYGNIAQMLEDNDAHITPFVRRPIVEPHGSIRIDTIFDVVNFSAGGAMGTPTNFTALFLGAGAGMGLLGDLEVGVMPLPFFILVDPDSDFEFGSIPLYGMYRFFGNQTVDIAGRMELIIPTGSDFASFAMTLGVPVRIRDAKGLLSIDTGVNVGLNFGTCDFCDDFTAGLYTAYPSPVGARGGGRPPFLPGTGIPLVVNFQPIDELFVGLRTGFVLGDFSEASNTQFIPLGLQAGYTLATSSNFMIDFNAGFNWPFFLAPGSDGDTVNADLWQITLAAEIHIDLFDRAGATAATTPPPSDPAQPTPIY